MPSGKSSTKKRRMNLSDPFTDQWKDQLIDEGYIDPVTAQKIALDLEDVSQYLHKISKLMGGDIAV
tara:strand:+ start:178 stop:375 length:198 start_codon:yes stop_codon:yes gene_type:complete